MKLYIMQFYPVSY